MSVYSVSGKTQTQTNSLKAFFTCRLPPSPSLCSVGPGTAGNVEHGDQYQLKLLYEHNLQRTACCMTHGAFGGVSGVHLDSFYNKIMVISERERSPSCPLQSIERLEKPSRGKPSSQQHPRKTHRHTDTHTHSWGNPCKSREIDISK